MPLYVKENDTDTHDNCQWEVADIFRMCGQDYRRTHPLPLTHLRVMRALEVCRTEYLGGQTC